MSIRVARGGMLTSLQDLGRWKNQRYGVVVGGGMARLALRAANWLVGNEEDEAALEMAVVGPTLQFECDALVAACGADFAPRLGDQSFPGWRPVFVRRGSVITFGSAAAGCYGYLAIAGGFDVPFVMGSRSTYLRAGIGGFRGRCLQADDVLRTRAAAPHYQQLIRRLSEQHPTASLLAPPWHVRPAASYVTTPCTVRVILGSEFDWLTPANQEQFLAAEFAVTADSDRMGYRLSGVPLALESPRELESAATCCGTLQLPAGGNPILLMADCATTGGYPKIAHVVTADLPLVAQLRPGAKIRFAQVSLAAAHELYRELEHSLQLLKCGIQCKLAGEPADDSFREPQEK